MTTVTEKVSRTDCGLYQVRSFSNLGTHSDKSRAIVFGMFQPNMREYITVEAPLGNYQYTLVSSIDPTFGRYVSELSLHYIDHLMISLLHNDFNLEWAEARKITPVKSNLFYIGSVFALTKLIKDKTTYERTVRDVNANGYTGINKDDGERDAFAIVKVGLDNSPFMVYMNNKHFHDEKGSVFDTTKQVRTIKAVFVDNVEQ